MKNLLKQAMKPPKSVRMNKRELKSKKSLNYKKQKRLQKKHLMRETIQKFRSRKKSLILPNISKTDLR